MPCMTRKVAAQRRRGRTIAGEVSRSVQQPQAERSSAEEAQQGLIPAATTPSLQPAITVAPTPAQSPRECNAPIVTGIFGPEVSRRISEVPHNSRQRHAVLLSTTPQLRPALPSAGSCGASWDNSKHEPPTISKT